MKTLFFICLILYIISIRRVYKSYKKLGKIDIDDFGVITYFIYGIGTTFIIGIMIGLMIIYLP